MKTKTLALQYHPLLSVPLLYLLLCLFWILPVRADEMPLLKPWTAQLADVGERVDQVQQSIEAKDVERSLAQLIQLELAVEQLRKVYTPSSADTEENDMVSNDGLSLRLYSLLTHYYTQAINHLGCACRPAQLSGLFVKYGTYLERVREMMPPSDIASLRILDELITRGQAMQRQLKLASGA